MSKLGDRVFFRGEFACPWWICFTFDNRFRVLFQNPRKILGRYALDGETALDIGPGMGYFTVPLSRLTGEKGKVFALDIQEKMLERLKLRLFRRNCTNVVPVLYDGTTFGLPEKAGFVLLFWMFHEVKNKRAFLAELSAACKPKAPVLLVEPILHVTRKGFERTVSLFEEAGFAVQDTPKVGLSRAVLFRAR